MTPFDWLAAQMFWWLIVGHALADFALQSGDMARGKNPNYRTEPPPGAKYQPTWYMWLSAHALIHGGAVALVTGSVGLGMAETAAHWIIDFCKCHNLYGIKTDQGLHITCKIVWLLLLLWQRSTP